MYTIKEILHAGSVAIVGASSSSQKVGYKILKNILDGGFPGNVYPVNPGADTILGRTCYTGLLDIPGDVDLLVVCIPAVQVPDILRLAAQKNTKGAIIISGGFRESGNHLLDAQLMEAAEASHIRIIGPNCQGINVTKGHLCASWPLVTAQGTIGIVAQSGTIGAEMELLAQKDGLGVSCFAALGNKSDISEADFIQYFAEDPDTHVIALNIEGIQDTSAFLNAVKTAVQKKPVVILKPGRTVQGAKAVASHTSAIAGNDRLFSVFCKKYGIIRANDISEFYDFCKITACISPPLGNRLLVITSSGGSGILAVDEAETYGFCFDPLKEPVRLELQGLLPSQCVLSNPLDLTGDATAKRYETVLKLIADSSARTDYDSVLVLFGDPIPGAADVIAAIRKSLSIPVAVGYLGGGSIQEDEVLKMGTLQIPVFPTPERAIRALGTLMEQAKRRKVVMYE